LVDGTSLLRDVNGTILDSEHRHMAFTVPSDADGRSITLMHLRNGAMPTITLPVVAVAPPAPPSTPCGGALPGSDPSTWLTAENLATLSVAHDAYVSDVTLRLGGELVDQGKVAAFSGDSHRGILDLSARTPLYLSYAQYESVLYTFHYAADGAADSIVLDTTLLTSHELDGIPSPFELEGRRPCPPPPPPA
jgi:hypothetical protein